MNPIHTRTPQDLLEGELVQFLMSALTIFELERQIRYYTPALDVPQQARDAVLHAVQLSDNSMAGLTWALIDQIVRRQGEFGTLREALVQDRPGRTAHIDEALGSGDPAAVHALLVSLYSLHELERFTRVGLGNGDLWEAAVQLGPFLQAVRGLRRADLIREGFWQGLIRQRPGRTPEIQRLKARWEAAFGAGPASSAGSDPVPSPAAPVAAYDAAAAAPARRV